MFKLFYKRARAAWAPNRVCVTGHCSTDEWRRDPLAHPTLEAMNLRQLADLPARALRSCCRE